MFDVLMQFYLDPSSEYAFFSKKDALRYLESGDVIKCVVKPIKRDMNKDGPVSSSYFKKKRILWFLYSNFYLLMKYTSSR